MDLVALGPLIWLSAKFELCVLVSLVCLGCLARNVGGFYLDSCPGCGHWLAMASMLVVLVAPSVGCGFCGCIGLMPFSLCFRGGVVRLLSFLVAFLARCSATGCLFGHWPFW